MVSRTTTRATARDGLSSIPSVDLALDATGHAVRQVQATTEKTAAGIKRILTLDDEDLPKWMKQDPFIIRGYRRQLNSFRECFGSLFYLHNESVNTWSHLAPAIVYVALLLVADYETFSRGPRISSADYFVIQFYVAGTAACLLLSALFHGSNAHSHDVAKSFLKLDYFGIVLTISSTAISSTYFGLHDEQTLQRIYISLTVICATAVFSAVLSPKADGGQAAAWRAVVFISLALSGFVPIVHVAFVKGLVGVQRFPLLSISITCSCYLVGTAFYVGRFPERQWPGVFDIYGASHQVFHMLVAFGQLVHLLGLTSAMMKNYT